MRGIFAGAVFVAAVPTSAEAIDYISQFRALDANAAGIAVVHEENSALGFWLETANAAVATTAFPPLLIASGSASQTSDLLDQLVSMSGSLSASGADCCTGSGRSELSIEFSVDAPSPYFSMLSATGATNTSISASAGWDPTGSGTLAPGTYSLSVVFDVAAGGGSSASGTYLYSLAIVPEPSCAILMLIGWLLVVSRRIESR